jgi:hypothetical protein
MWNSVAGWVVPGVLKDHSAFILIRSVSSRRMILGPNDPEDEGSTFLQNVGNHLPSDTGSHLRRYEVWYSSLLMVFLPCTSWSSSMLEILGTKVVFCCSLCTKWHFLSCGGYLLSNYLVGPHWLIDWLIDWLICRIKWKDAAVTYFKVLTSFVHKVLRLSL